jgi:hypothetical protein
MSSLFHIACFYLTVFFGPRKKEELGQRKLHNEELHNLYFSHIIRLMKSK